MSRGHASRHLNAARRRERKRTLARRDGARCFYCWTPFPDLRAATLDHVVPISLFFTWRPQNLVLACHSCNDRKADRLPLSVALLLCAQSADDLRDRQRHGGRDGRDGGCDAHGAAVLDWPGLARLAHAAQSAADARTVPATVTTQPRARVGRLHTPDRERSTGVNRASTPVDRSTADHARPRPTSGPGTGRVNGRSTPVSHRSTGVNRAASRALPRAHDTQPRTFRAQPQTSRAQPRASRAHVTRLCDVPRTSPCDGRPSAGVVSV
ncbi:HNH endonuclease [Streptomyces sp. NPDC056669]|uniref:HNH endonuclease n=1 Tax=Streptomyces sp. NPDC056669 TaxID=3345903 RepID=UPI0036ACA860